MFRKTYHYVIDGQSDVFRIINVVEFTIAGLVAEVETQYEHNTFDTKAYAFFFKKEDKK